MNAERVRIECALQDDARLTAAIPLIVSHSARLAGIADTIAESFANEAAESCRKALRVRTNAEDGAAILLTVDQFQDRIEVTLEYSGDHIAEQGSIADSVQQESRDGKSRLKFIKFCGTVHRWPSK